MIIANATPLIYLHRIRQLELLHQLFTQVTIPEEVARELQMGQHGEATIPELPWIRVMSVQHRSTVDVLARVWLFRNDTELNKINILQRNMLEKRPLRG